MKTLDDENTLLADVLATFPGIFARPLRQFSPRYAEAVGLWLAGENNMPDGLPMFSTFLHDCDTHDCFVHKGFLAWLELRGWYIEAYDGATFLAFPIDDSPADSIAPQAAADTVVRGPWAAGGAHAG